MLNHNNAYSHAISNLQISKTLTMLNKLCKHLMKYTSIRLDFQTCSGMTFLME